MCQAQDRPVRRHRAAYLAPAVGRNNSTDDNDDQIIPLLVEVPTHSGPVSPPSSGELLSTHELIQGAPPPSPSSVGGILKSLQSMYRWLVDFILVVVMCCLATFFYDVDVSVVKSNRRRAREARRVVIRRTNNHMGRETSLLRTPPHSGNVPWGFV